MCQLLNFNFAFRFLYWLKECQQISGISILFLFFVCEADVLFIKNGAWIWISLWCIFNERRFSYNKIYHIVGNVLIHWNKLFSHMIFYTYFGVMVQVCWTNLHIRHIYIFIPLLNRKCPWQSQSMSIIKYTTVSPPRRRCHIWHIRVSKPQKVTDSPSSILSIRMLNR